MNTTATKSWRATKKAALDVGSELRFMDPQHMIHMHSPSYMRGYVVRFNNRGRSVLVWMPNLSNNDTECLVWVHMRQISVIGERLSLDQMLTSKCTEFRAYALKKLK